LALQSPANVGFRPRLCENANVPLTLIKICSNQGT